VDIDLQRTATGNEVIWSISGVIGCVIVAWALWDTVWDWIAVNSNFTAGPVRKRAIVIARVNVRHAIEIAIVLVVLTFMGIWLMLTPPANPERPVTPVGFGLSGAGTFISVLLSVGVILDRLDRHILLRLARRQRLKEKEAKKCPQ